MRYLEQSNKKIRDIHIYFINYYKPSKPTLAVCKQANKMANKLIENKFSYNKFNKYWVESIFGLNIASKLIVGDSREIEKSEITKKFKFGIKRALIELTKEVYCFNKIDIKRYLINSNIANKYEIRRYYERNYKRFIHTIFKQLEREYRIKLSYRKLNKYEKKIYKIEDNKFYIIKKG